MYTIEPNEMTGWDVLDETGYPIAERASEANAQRIAAALNRCDRLDREDAGQWVCDACEKWQVAETENVGHDCDMCPACAAIAALEAK